MYQYCVSVTISDCSTKQVKFLFGTENIFDETRQMGAIAKSGS